MARVQRQVWMALVAVCLVAGVGLVAVTPGGSVIGPNPDDITAGLAFPGWAVTFTVTTGHPCDPTSSFIPPNSTVTVLNQAGTTMIVPPTNMAPTATGGTVTVTLPSDLALGTYTMQFLCNSEESSIFGSNEFSVTEPPPPLGFLVRTVVVGERSPGTVVEVQCATDESVLPHSVRLGFDQDGRATVAAGDVQGWEIVPAFGDWSFLTHSLPATRTTCTFTEIETGGAARVDWQCFDGQIGGPLGLSCSANASASGTGPGPITVLIGASDDEIAVQEVDLVFTNTFETQPVVATPSFTG